MEDILKDFEQLEYYKRRLKTHNRRLVVFCVVCFVLGVSAARFYYLMF